jgi:signal transduction histidine kinase
VAAILTAAFITSVIIQQRRYLATTRSFSGRLLAAQEEERSRIARELHDDVIQRVALLGHALDELAEFAHTDDPAFERRVRGLRAELIDFADEIRSLAHRMHPPVLDHLGLPAALSMLAQELATVDSLSVRVEAPEALRSVPSDVAACLYRVAQEALRNVVKHAEASEAVVQLSLDRGGVEMLVQDDGVGFDPLSLRGGGLGLTSITERARQFDGRVSVHSRPGEGTRVIVWLPLREEA